MEKCSCYHTRNKIEYKLKSHTPISELFNSISYEEIKKEVGICSATQDCEECLCGGDRTKCDFYPDFYEEIKLKAQKEEIENSLDYKITQAIKLLIDNGYEVKKYECLHQGHGDAGTLHGLPVHGEPRQ